MMSSYNSSCFGKIVSFLVVLFGPNLKFVSKEVPIYWYYFLILLIYIFLLLSSARSVSYNAIFQRRSAFYQWMHQTRRILIVIENLCQRPHIFRDLHLFQFQYNSPRKILLLICWVCMFLATKGKISGKNVHCSKGGNFFFKSLNFSFWDSRSHMRHYCLLYCFIHFWASWFPPTYFTERVKMINEFVYQAISKQL